MGEKVTLSGTEIESIVGMPTRNSESPSRGEAFRSQGLRTVVAAASNEYNNPIIKIITTEQRLRWRKL